MRNQKTKLPVALPSNLGETSPAKGVQFGGMLYQGRFENALTDQKWRS
jgi:hypothetical protein